MDLISVLGTSRIQADMRFRLARLSVVPYNFPDDLSSRQEPQLRNRVKNRRQAAALDALQTKR
jgi:hypothetical protein